MMGKRKLHIVPLWISVMALLASILSCELVDIRWFRNLDAVLLVYMAGANSLDKAGLADMAEMAGAEGSLFGANAILVLYDRMEGSGDGPDDWNETRLFEIVAVDGKAAVRELDCPALGLSTDYIDDEVDMGDAAVLSGFLDFAEASYGPRRWYLDIWNHGGGWRSLENDGSGPREVASDDESGSCLTMPKIRKALESFDGRFEIVIMDACYMATVEVAATFLGKADYLAASQEPMPYEGLPYGSVVPILFGPGTGESRAKAIRAAYLAGVSSGTDASMSVLRVDAEAGMERFAAGFGSYLGSIDQGAMREARAGAEAMPESSVDIGAFDDGSGAWDDLLALLVVEAGGEGLSGASIYFPEYFHYDAYAAEYAPEGQVFLRLYPYQEWLATYLHSGLPWTDTAEPDGSRDLAASLSGSTRSKLWCSQDRDYYLVEILPGKGLRLRLEPPADADFDLRLFWTDAEGKEAERQSTEGLGAVDEVVLSAVECACGKVYALVFPSGGSYDQEEEYLLSASPID